MQVSLNLPFGLGGVSGTWEADEAEQEAAWEMYVELVTRVAIVELRRDEGLLREALSSLYGLFGTTREILRRHGPSVARPKGKGTYSFGRLAVIILNDVLRPLLATWHPLLQEWEATRPAGVSQVEHERLWPRYAEFRAALSDVQETLRQYADSLARVADVPALGGPPDGAPA